jgi:hypothetical protein
MKQFLPVLLLITLTSGVQGQVNKKYYLRDSVDGALDVSNWLIEANGFIPLTTIITEPALGGIGVAVVPIFLTKRPPHIDTLNGKIVRTPNPPDITGAAAIYTANNTWLLGAFRSGSWIKQHIRYRIIAGYGDVNLTFYKTLPVVGEQSFDFSFKVLPVSGFAMKQIARSHWYGGIQYLYLNTEIKRTSPLFPDYVTPKEYKSNISQPGVITEYDTRDNIFTPNRGFKFHADFSVSNDKAGSDFNYTRLITYMYAYQPLAKNVTGGFRADMQQIFDAPPFYLLPFVDIRGIPSARYQGNKDALTEGELRWDLYKRWSVVGFGGIGKAFNSWDTFKDAELVYAYGTGFRYLVARKFNLRMGADIARGPEQWAFYIIFGSAWLK